MFARNPNAEKSFRYQPMRNKWSEMKLRTKKYWCLERWLGRVHANFVKVPTIFPLCTLVNAKHGLHPLQANNMDSIQKLQQSPRSRPTSSHNAMAWKKNVEKMTHTPYFWGHSWRWAHLLTAALSPPRKPWRLNSKLLSITSRGNSSFEYTTCIQSFAKVVETTW